MHGVGRLIGSVCAGQLVKTQISELVKRNNQAPVLSREKLTSIFWVMDEYDTLMISIRKGELTKAFSTLVICMCETCLKSLIEPSSS